VFKTFIDYSALLFVRILIFMMCVLPYKLGFALARFIIFMLGLAMPRIHAVGLRNLALVFPEKSSEEHKQILSESYNVLARNLLGYAWIPRLKEPQFKGRLDLLDTTERLEQVRKAANGVGILFVMPHFGSFEMVFQLWAILVCPVAILARGFGLPKLDAWWNSRREIYGHEMFPRSGGYKEIVSRLRSGQDVGLMFDQNVKRNHAIFVDLFGINAATTKTVGLASLRTGAPVVFVSMLEKGIGDFEIVVEPIGKTEDEPGKNEEKIALLTRKLHIELEQVIRKHPESWFWIHRRYKTRPEGEAEDTYK